MYHHRYFRRYRPPSLPWALDIPLQQEADPFRNTYKSSASVPDYHKYDNVTRNQDRDYSLYDIKVETTAPPSARIETNTREFLLS